jgi:hypothetical protein
MPKRKHDGKKKRKGGRDIDYRDLLRRPSSLVKPLTRKRLHKELRATRRIEFGPEQRQLKAEQRASRLSQQRIGDWFPQYQAEVARLGQQTVRGYGGAIGQIQGTAQQGADYAEQLRQRLRQEDEADAARRGAVYDPSGSYTAASANLARMNTAQSYTGMLGAQAANQGGYFADKERIARGEELNQLLREEARGRSINADLRDLAQRKRKFAAEYTSRVRPQERDFYLGLLQAKLGDKASARSAQTSRASSKRSARQAAANRRETRRHNLQTERTSQGNLRQRRRENRQEQRDGGDGGKVDRTHVQHMMNTLRLTNRKKLRKWSRAEAIARLQNESATYTRREAELAYRRWKKSQGGRRRHIGGPS